jgi:class 3 adenylate cyclase
MEAAPPFPVVTGQRQLAAIMFTDVVGYSAQMHDAELATLNRVERDLASMRRTVENRSGLVMKMTGDGLLIQFASAVEAVACALEIQRTFHSRLEAGVISSPLRHRIGIHVGDVFVTEGDVMGDGVNIAARLVAIAPPGGIVISQMVFEMVKNKLPLHTVRLGAQQLKNIKAAVNAYKVLLEDPALAATAPPPPVAPAGGVPVPAPAPAPGGASRLQKVAALVLLVAGLAVAGNYFFRQYLAHEEELAASQSAQAALGARLKKSDEPKGDALPAAPAAADFAALTTATPARLQGDGANAALIQSATTSANLLLAWLTSELARYTKDRPLVVTGLGDPAFAGARIFTGANQEIFFAEGGAFRRRTWAELKEPVQAAIIVSALSQASPPAGPELQRGAEAFAYLNGQPAMLPALPR